MTIKERLEKYKENIEPYLEIRSIYVNGYELVDLLTDAIKELEEYEKIKSKPNVDIDIYDKEEIHENCTVQIWSNSKTGKCSIGWRENHKKEELV